MSSKRKTPNAKTSVFSSTTPCMKYSGAKCLWQIDQENILIDELSCTRFKGTGTVECITQMFPRLELLNDASTVMEAILLIQNLKSTMHIHKQKENSNYKLNNSLQFYLICYNCEIHNHKLYYVKHLLKIANSI